MILNHQDEDGRKGSLKQKFAYKNDVDNLGFIFSDEPKVMERM
jgi:hypothetical protein